jgi:hypothetical protein
MAATTHKHPVADDGFQVAHWPGFRFLSTIRDRLSPLHCRLPLGGVPPDAPTQARDPENDKPEDWSP